MSLFITSLNSGSNGNCYYVGNDTEAILVDAGISCREIEKRMKRLGLSMQKVKAVFVSHEHTDHIKGLTTLVKKYHLPVYITSATLLNSRIVIDKEHVYAFTSDQPTLIGSMSITAFPKYHDACDPYSFMVSCNQINVGIFTDIGVPCKQLIKHFQQCHAAFLESNYDEEMLDKGSYPYHLKKRIRGGKGHLSNNQALELFRKYKPPRMTHLLLSHLSANNNCPHKVQELFDTYCEGVKMIVASRFKETEVYQISSSAKVRVEKHKSHSTAQLAFSFA